MIRNARLDDVPTIQQLISTHAELDIMLFRSQADLYESLRDFKLYELQGQVVGCCALSIVWQDLAELRSLAVSDDFRGRGVGSELVNAAIDEARQLHLPKIFALTLEESFFTQFGFKTVPMSALPLKVWSDCVRCPKQDHCDEVAMIYEVT